jgi:hypothetical protein
LYARIAEAQNAAKRSEQRRLTESRNSLQQNVPARNQADQNAIDDLLLAYDDLPYFVSDLVKAGYSFVQLCVCRHNLILDEPHETGVSELF